MPPNVRFARRRALTVDQDASRPVPDEERLQLSRQSGWELFYNGFFLLSYHVIG